jgi:hypothetical protein
VSIKVEVIAGGCTWFGVGTAGEVFAFKWPPFGDVSVQYTISPDLVHIITTYRETGHAVDAIYMERRLADVDGERIAFHDALFVSEALRAQQCGFATEMLRRCIPYYGRLGIRRVMIPLAVEAGRIVWPKFGFRPSELISASFSEYLAALHKSKLGTELDQPVPRNGPGLLDFRGSYGFAIGRLALQTFSGLTLELDLADPDTIRSLKERGIQIL